MNPDSIIKFLSERNRQFIDSISSESALGLYRNRPVKDQRKKLVILSFDPPMGSPPFALGWESYDIHYFASPALDPEVYHAVDQALVSSESQIVVILERENPPHQRKINRWVKNFKDTVYRNRSLAEMPVFILAEYKSPLMPMTYSELKPDMLL